MSRESPIDTRILLSILITIFWFFFDWVLHLFTLKIIPDERIYVCVQIGQKRVSDIWALQLQTSAAAIAGAGAGN